MAAPQNFRSAFNGFNREDVVHYLEFIQNKYQTQIHQLTMENEELRGQLAEQEDVMILQMRCNELEQELQTLRSQDAQPREEAEAPVVQHQPESGRVTNVGEELEAYRRAERMEREARERSELVYYQANGVLTEATGKVDGITQEVTELADQIMSQLTQFQMAISSSKQALQDAASLLGTIKPNK